MLGISSDMNYYSKLETIGYILVDLYRKELEVLGSLKNLRKGYDSTGLEQYGLGK